MQEQVPPATSSPRQHSVTLASRRPTEEEYDSEYHQQLIGLVPGHCVLQALKQQKTWFNQISQLVSTEQVDRIHPPYQWTIRQVFEHCVNTERLQGYRMMAIADGSQPTLPNWDENVSADSRFGLGNLTRLIDEWNHLRQANVDLLVRLTPRSWQPAGKIAGHRITVRALAWVTAGHLQHHLQIVEKRCGITAKDSP
ncbi:MAG: hypothetical protein CBB71_01465 [Rhodopirellula sp. TMED11]|nr:MAG: hypothetical protein CBB71_01465 [Rhodopirellula sp. TMED11]